MFLIAYKQKLNNQIRDHVKAIAISVVGAGQTPSSHLLYLLAFASTPWPLLPYKCITSVMWHLFPGCPHVIFPLCISGHLSKFPFIQDIGYIGSRPTSMTHLNWITSVKLLFQIISHSSGLGVRTSVYLFWGDAIQFLTPSVMVNFMCQLG